MYFSRSDALKSSIVDKLREEVSVYFVIQLIVPGKSYLF